MTFGALGPHPQQGTRTRTLLILGMSEAKGLKLRVHTWVIRFRKTGLVAGLLDVFGPTGLKQQVKTRVDDSEGLQAPAQGLNIPSC